MPVAQRKPDSLVQPELELPRVGPKDVELGIIDDLSVPISSLIAYIDGAPWTVDYYSQLITKHQNLREVDPGQSALYQSYTKIKGLELRVQSALQDSFDPSTGISTVNGTALIYPFITPNQNDYFVTEAGDGKLGIFKVTNVERKTFNLESAFAVDYVLVGYADVEVAIYNDLEAKSGRIYNFDKNRLVDGSSPILRDEEYQLLSDLRTSYKYMVTSYFGTFFNTRYKTLVLPGQDYAIYDTQLVKYLMSLVDVFDAPQIRKVEEYNGDNDPYLQQPDFWHVLRERNYALLSATTMKKGIVSRGAFNNNTYIRGVRFSLIDYLVYPIDADETTQITGQALPKVTNAGAVLATDNRFKTPLDIVAESYDNGHRSIVSYDTTFKQDYYVLSREFYTGTDNLTCLEILTRDYLKRKTLDLKMLAFVVNRYPNWSRLEQFYYGPVIMTLLKAADSGVYS